MPTIDPSPRERARRRGAGRWTGAVAILAAVLLAFAAPVLRPIGSAVGAPLYGAASWLGHVVAPLGDYLSSKRSLADSNRQLAATVEQLSAAAIERDGLARERDQLRATLGFRDENRSAVAAEVIARPPATAYDTLLVSRGAADGVAEGEYAYAGDVPVGVVTRVSSQSSVLTLLSAPGSTLAVSLGGRAVTATGRGDGRFEVDLPAQLAPATGTPATTPDGEPIASVSAVLPGAADDAARVLLASPVDLQLVRYVSILAPKTR